MSFKRKLMLGAAISLASVGGAVAQTAPQTSDTDRTTQVDEIVVTAQKREERLVDVPLAVTAVSGDQLSAARIDSTSDLDRVVPSLSFTQSTNEQNSNFRIRGVGSALFGTGFESSVSIVLDGVVLARQGQGFTDLIDVERIEVLRGPQGTLFGKNASAGVINIVTRRPSDTLEAFADVVVAEDDEYRVRGSVSGPLSETLGYRLTGFYTDVGGHIRNVANGDNLNGTESVGGRLQLAWTPTERLDVLAIADYRESTSNCCQYQSRSIGNPVFAAAILPVVAGPENDEVNLDGFVGGGTEQYGVSLQGAYDFGDAGTLTSITAYRTWDFRNNQDVDGTFNPVPLVGLTQLNVNGGTTEIRQRSQELRFDSPSGGRLEYTVGLYYFGLEIDRTFQRRIGACIPNPALPPLNLNVGLAPGTPCRAPIYTSFAFTSAIEQDSYAAFGQATFNVTEPLAVIAGFRLQTETQDARGDRPGTPVFPGDLDIDPNTPNPPFPTGATNPLSALRPSQGSASVEDDDLSGKLGLQYTFNRNAQTYVTWTRGYKGRAFDTEVTQDFANLVALEPETVSAFELGAKTITLDGRLNLNVALFHSEYDNLQIQGFDRENALFRAINAGQSTVQGLEVEFGFTPVDGLTLNGGLTLLDAKTDIDGISCFPGQTTIPEPTGGGLEPGTCYRRSPTVAFQNIREGELPNAPDVRYSVTGRYERDLAGVPFGAFVQASVKYTGDLTFDINQDPVTRQESYTLVDASVGLTDDEGRYTLSLFVKNLFDESYASAIFRDPLSAVSTAHFLPKDHERYFGASLRVDF